MMSNDTTISEALQKIPDITVGQVNEFAEGVLMFIGAALTIVAIIIIGIFTVTYFKNRF